MYLHSVDGLERGAERAVASRRLLKVALDDEIKACRHCDGMNIDGRVRAELRQPDITCGAGRASLCENCMANQTPITGGSGDLIDESIKRSGREKKGLFISNTVHCHPPKNRASHEARDRQLLPVPAPRVGDRPAAAGNHAGLRRRTRHGVLLPASKDVGAAHENGPQSNLRGPFYLVAGTGFEPATSGL
ncbi:hypothetical protein MMARJ_23810 [Mycobacterium marseillense]|uniref:Uncharacterized protein n=1 Tax=Mycobacterium marseillense TaxID=701042 RepID=A0ABM7JD41_9MYCO|nr:hypothetical protein MMARJ_23810 [Mycobacterium marseillense]